MRRLAWAAAGAAGLAPLPFLSRPLSPDEGGFLLVASQWGPGHSLYGHYWVDRPPLLLMVFDVASHLGGAVGLRLIGVVAVVASVVLTSATATAATGRRTVVPALVAAIFLSTPLFGTTEVDGELLAVPLVLVGALALVRSWSARVAGGLAWSAAAGAAGAGAFLVKQNVVDVFVAAGVLLVLTARRSGLRATARSASVIAVGALTTLAFVLGVAETRGTEPGRLWDAVVTFRAQAASVIQASSSSATPARFHGLLVAALLSGVPVVVLVLAVRLRAPARAGAAPDLRAVAVAVLLWEAVAVVGGGSYWLHYLIGLVPGLVLLAVAAAQREVSLPRSTGVALALSAVSCLAAIAVVATSDSTRTDDEAVAAYLRTHSGPHDSVVVGFGHPDIVYESGLRSPYQELWSLPVRVRDPDLRGLDRILEGPRAPTWVVVAGSSLDTWGVDASRATATLDARYRPAATVGAYVVWRRDDATAVRFDAGGPT